jgi:hypothetical protein
MRILIRCVLAPSVTNADFAKAPAARARDKAGDKAGDKARDKARDFLRFCLRVDADCANRVRVSVSAAKAGQKGSVLDPHA